MMPVTASRLIRPGNAYVVGQTSSTNFPTLNAFQTFLNGTNDTFLAKILLHRSRSRCWPSLPPAARTSLWSGPGFDPEFVLESNTNLTSTNWLAVPQFAGADQWFGDRHPAGDQRRFVLPAAQILTVRRQFSVGGGGKFCFPFPMKNILRTILPAFLLMAFMGGSALAQTKIATVDLKKLFDNYYKTKLAAGRHPGTRRPARQG